MSITNRRAVSKWSETIENPQIGSVPITVSVMVLLAYAKATVFAPAFSDRSWPLAGDLSLRARTATHSFSQFSSHHIHNVKWHKPRTPQYLPTKPDWWFHRFALHVDNGNLNQGHNEKSQPLINQGWEIFSNHWMEVCTSCVWRLAFSNKKKDFDHHLSINLEPTHQCLTNQWPIERPHFLIHHELLDRFARWWWCDN